MALNTPPPCPPPHFIQTKFRSALPSRTINETQEVPLSLVLFSLSFMFGSYKYFPDETHWMEYFIKIEIATDFCKQNRPGVIMLNVLLMFTVIPLTFALGLYLVQMTAPSCSHQT